MDIGITALPKDLARIPEKSVFVLQTKEVLKNLDRDLKIVVFGPKKKMKR